jgi:hypothetical protein
MRRRILKLNPVWINLGLDSPKIYKEMFETTLRHEIIHFFAWDIYKDKGHGNDWKLLMKDIGEDPDVYNKSGVLPPWMQSKQLLLKEKFAELQDEELDEIEA